MACMTDGAVVVVGITMVRDEADVIGQTLRNMAESCDLVVVADNGSRDRTRAILEESRDALGYPLVIQDDPEVGYYQSQKMTALAESAAGMVQERFGLDPREERTWIVPFDADEWWTDVSALRETSVNVVQVPGKDHRVTGLDPGGHPFRSMRWRNQTGDSFRPKVAFRYSPGAVIAQGNHSVQFPSGGVPATVGHPLRIHHFPIRSAEQFIRKARNGGEAYRATTLPRGWGAHWRRWGEMSDSELENLFLSEFYVPDPVAAGLAEDPVL